MVASSSFVFRTKTKFHDDTITVDVRGASYSVLMHTS